MNVLFWRASVDNWHHWTTLLVISYHGHKITLCQTRVNIQYYQTRKKSTRTVSRNDSAVLTTFWKTFSMTLILIPITLKTLAVRGPTIWSIWISFRIPSVIHELSRSQELPLADLDLWRERGDILNVINDDDLIFIFIHNNGSKKT